MNMCRKIHISTMSVFKLVEKNTRMHRENMQTSIFTTIWLSGDCILAIAVNISSCLSLCWPYDRLTAYPRYKPALIQ